MTSSVLLAIGWLITIAAYNIKCHRLRRQAKVWQNAAIILQKELDKGGEISEAQTNADVKLERVCNLQEIRITDLCAVLKLQELEIERLRK